MQKKKGVGARASRKRIRRAQLGRDVGATMRKVGEKLGWPPSAKGRWVDPDDAPELTKEYFERADLYHGDKLVRRGRPPSANPKRALKLRIDADIVEHFRATGPGWQTRINDTLRRAAKLKARA